MSRQRSSFGLAFLNKKNTRLIWSRCWHSLNNNHKIFRRAFLSPNHHSTCSLFIPGFQQKYYLCHLEKRNWNVGMTYNLRTYFRRQMQNKFKKKKNKIVFILYYKILRTRSKAWKTKCCPASWYTAWEFS